MKISIYYLFLFVIFFASCSKDQLEMDQVMINSYLLEHHKTAKEAAVGIYYHITRAGIGEKQPDSLSQVTIEFKGYLTDNTVFDAALGDQALTIPFVDLIDGLQTGIALLTEGAEATFYIPSDLGYGEANKAGIPPHSVLIFDIKLVDIE